jgi:hypothetical protein
MTGQINVPETDTAIDNNIVEPNLSPDYSEAQGEHRHAVNYAMDEFPE